MSETIQEILNRKTELQDVISSILVERKEPVGEAAIVLIYLSILQLLMSDYGKYNIAATVLAILDAAEDDVELLKKRELAKSSGEEKPNEPK